jgi:diphthamide synthase subunit DPH2
MEFVPLVIIGVVIGFFINASKRKNSKRTELTKCRYVSSNIPVIEKNVCKRRMVITMSKYRIKHTCGGICDTSRINKKYNLVYNVINDNTQSSMANYINTIVSETSDTSLDGFADIHTYIDISCSDIDTIEDADQRNMYVVNWMAI